MTTTHLESYRVGKRTENLMKRGSTFLEALSVVADEAATRQVKFKQTFCSQCGKEFGPANHGYSHCTDHVANDKVSGRPHHET